VNLYQRFGHEFEVEVLRRRLERMGRLRNHGGFCALTVGCGSLVHHYAKDVAASRKLRVVAIRPDFSLIRGDLLEAE
jgi:hypothetical protein